MYQKSWWYDLQLLRYRVWQTEIGNYGLPSVLLRPLPHRPLNLLKLRILKKWKSIWRCDHFAHVYQKSRSLWCMLLEIWSTTDIIFCHFGPFFYLFTPLKTPKIKSWKKCKQAWRNYPFTHVYHKWGSYHYCSCDIRCNGQLFVIWGHFLPFDPPNNPKYQNFEKWKKAWGYYHFTLVYHKWWSYDVWFLRYRARQIEFFCHFGPFFALLPY